MSIPHFDADKIEAQEHIGHSCPICEAPIYRVRAEGKNWLSCQCMAEEEFTGWVASDSGVHKSITEIWEEEVRSMMQNRPDIFPPESLPGPIEGID